MAEELPAWVSQGAGLATCALLGAGTQVAANAAAASVVTGQLYGAIGGVAATAAFAGLAAAMGCTHNPGSPSGNGLLQGDWCADESSTNIVTVEGREERFRGVLSMVPVPDGATFGGQKYNVLKIEFGGRDADGKPVFYTELNDIPSKGGFSVRYEGTCSGDNTRPGDQPGPDAYDYIHTSPDGCQFKYMLDGAYIDSTGYPNLQWKIEGLGNTVQRANGPITCTGGRIAGYNWSIDNSKHFTFNPDFGGDGPLGPFGKIDPVTLGKILLDILLAFDVGTTYRLTSSCEVDSEGEPIDKAVEVVIPPAIRKPDASTNVRLAAIVQLLQGLQDFKKKTCDCNPKAPLVGRNISIQFRSTEISPWGNQALRKAFRYRDPSLKPLEEHRSHWATFTWKSGPFMVISEGLPWGKPRVWAESEAEGKRVLTHAATIAGLDLADPKHKWIVREVNGARENPVLEMKVHRDAQGLLWIAERNEPGGFPEVVAQVSSDINVAT